jgi:hypothetical protein
LLILKIQVDLLIQQKMYWLQTIAQYELTLPSLKSYRDYSKWFDDGWPQGQGNFGLGAA